MNGTECEKVLGTVKTLIITRIFTVRNEVGKVMFLQVCVCPQGGVLSQHALQLGVCSQRGGAWWGVPGLGVPGPGSAWSGECLVWADPPWERRLLLRTVRILLECILVSIELRHEVSV